MRPLKTLSNLKFVSSAAWAARLAADSAEAALEAASLAALLALAASEEAWATDVFKPSICDCKLSMSEELAQPTNKLTAKATIDNLTTLFMSFPNLVLPKKVYCKDKMVWGLKPKNLHSKQA
jgi:hypothetical protein